MVLKKNSQNEDKALFLYGYVEKEEDKAENRNEKRANLLYNHPDNEKTINSFVRIEPLEENLYSTKVFLPEEPVYFRLNESLPQRKTSMRDLKQERKNNIGKFYDKKMSTLKREGADFLINNFYNQVGTHVVKVLGGPDAEESLRMSLDDQYLNTSFAKENKIYRNVSEVTPFLRGHVAKKIKSQLGQDSVDKIGGIFRDVDTDVSRKIAQSDEIKTYIKKNKDRLLDYGYIEKDSIAFNEKNLHNTFGRADIIDMNLTPEGEITFYILDVYDFNKGDTNPIVQAGRRNQEKGRIIPYFSIDSVKIDKERTQRYLNGN